MKENNIQFESRPSLDCFRTACCCLELAKQSKQEWEIQHHCVTGIIFSAFSIEAMLNHYAKIYFLDLDKIKLERKQSHKRIFSAANLTNYLGSSNYQNAKSCFELRDRLAHGKTAKDKIVMNAPENINDSTFIAKILTTPSEPFRAVNVKLLELFINTAVAIQNDIENSGYYPPHHPRSGEKLLECPLSVSGLFEW